MQRQPGMTEGNSREAAVLHVQGLVVTCLARTVILSPRRQAANPIGWRRAVARRKFGARWNGSNRRSRRLHDAEAQGSGEGHHAGHTGDKLGAEDKTKLSLSCRLALK